MIEKIRIGILIKCEEIHLWEYKILNKLSKSDYAEIKLVIIDKGSYEKTDKYGSFFYRLHEGIDRIIFRKKFDYDKKINIANLIKNTPNCHINPINEESSSPIFKNIINGLLKYRLDVILSFGFKLIRNDYLKLSKFGIWSYKIENSRINNAVPSGFREFIKKAPQKGYVIQNIGNNASGIVIFLTSISTHYSNSINQNRNCIFNLASLIIPRIIKGLFIFGDSYIEYLTTKYNGSTEAGAPEFYKPKSFVKPFVDLSQHLLNYLYKKFFYLEAESYSLFFNINKNLSSQPFKGDFIELRAPKDKYWADPFVVIQNNYYYIFVEEFLYGTNKGHISVLKLDNKGILYGCERIIEKSYHMSFPFILEFGNSYFMIPETKADNTIQLYSCTQFPDKWEFVMNLMENVVAVDSTLYFHNNLWWLFTSIDQMGDPLFDCYELYLFYTDDLFSGKWISHPKNPVETDMKITRSAGKIFSYKDKIYRPSQDCSGLYGKAFNISQITKLSKTKYQEIFVSNVEPRWEKTLKGTHTFNFDKDIIIIDGYSFRKRINFNLFNNWRLDKLKGTFKSTKTYSIDINF